MEKMRMPSKNKPTEKLDAPSSSKQRPSPERVKHLVSHLKAMAQQGLVELAPGNTVHPSINSTDLSRRIQ